MSAKQQMKLIADYIMANVPGEPSGDTGGAGDCAVRLLDKYRTALVRIMHELGAPGTDCSSLIANAYRIAMRALD